MEELICVSQIQNFSVNDGEGIRTTVFLSGCPLRCRWCGNPETWTPQIRQGRGPDGKTETFGRLLSPDGVMREIRRQIVFYRASGGGVTWSGGEPFFFPENLRRLTAACEELGISQAAETSGCFSWKRSEEIVRSLDFIFADIKHMDPEEHEKITGAKNGLILDNLKRIGTTGVETVIRVPLVAGINDGEKNILRTAAFVSKYLPSKKMEFLPYHDFGKIKYRMLGMENAWRTFEAPSPEHVRSLEDLVRAQGVEVVRYR